jgi:hypothetical protein
MPTPIANVHRHTMPAPGAIVVIPALGLGWRRSGRRAFCGQVLRRFIVESYPLSDAADQRYSRGIHTCNVRALDDGRRYHTVAGHWCQEP